MGSLRRISILGALALLMASPAVAQFSDSFNFLKAVKDRKGSDVMTYLNKPGQPALNARDGSSGDTALHIVVRRHDQEWLAFLLSRGADTSLRDRAGMTPLLVAAQLQDPDAIRVLLAAGARVNVVNDNGESPLVLAVHNRDLVSVRLLLQNGADPTVKDSLAGKNARDYAAEDRRAAAIAKALQDEAKPRTAAAKMIGPTR